MIFIYIIIAFLLGIAFIQWIIPLIDGIANLFLTKVEVWKSNMLVKITESQQKISEIKDNFNSKGNTSAIGFVVQSDEEDDYYDDE